MDLCRRIGLIGFAALFLCLPGMLQARDQDYTIHLVDSTPLAKVELSVTPASTEWDVIADYDAERCEIHCSWRRKRDAFGSLPPFLHLLPPIAVIRIYSNFVSRPVTVTIDPAGLGLPGAARDVPLRLDAIFIAARKLFVTPPALRDDGGTPKRPRAHFLSTTKQPDIASSSALPLRI